MLENTTDHQFENAIDTQLFLTLCKFFETDENPELSLLKAQALIQDGANINAIGHVEGKPQYKTYLVAAAFDENPWEYSTDKLSLLFPFLFENGFDPSIDNGISGSRMFCLLANYSQNLNEKHFAIFRYLIEHGVDPYLPCYIFPDDEECSCKYSPHGYLMSREIDNFATGFAGPDCQKLFGLYYFLSLNKEGKDFSQVEFAQKSVGRSLQKLCVPFNVKLEQTSAPVLLKFAYDENIDENLPSLKLSLSEKSLYYSYPSDLVIDAQDPVEFGDINLLPKHLIGSVISDIGYGYSHPPKCVDPNILTIVFENKKYLEIRYDREENGLATLTVSEGEDITKKIKDSLDFISCVFE